MYHVHVYPAYPSPRFNLVQHCCILFADQGSFKRPSNCFFLPCTDLHQFIPPVFFSPSPVLFPVFKPAACLLHPRQLPDRRQTGPDRWPASVTGWPQRALPVSSHFLLSAPLPEPRCLTPPQPTPPIFLLGEHHAKQRFPFHRRAV